MDMISNFMIFRQDGNIIQSYLSEMNQIDRKKIQQSISLLQQILGQKSSSSGIPKITIPNFQPQVQNFTKISSQAQPQLQQLTHILTESISLMQNILNYSSAAKAPTQPQKKALQEKFVALSKRTQVVEKNQNFCAHARAVRELLSVTFWVFTNSPEFIIKGGIEAADFNAIKFQKNKNQLHNQWYKSIGKAFRILEDFTKKQFPMGLNYNSQGTASWSDLISGNAPQQAQQPQPQQHSNQPTQAQQKPQAPKPPKKQLQGLNWFVANTNNQKITFAPGQIQMKHGVFIQNCNDCTITIDDKFKSLQMNKSSNVVLVVNTCVSGVQVMNGENIQVYIRGQTPSISVDKCQRVRVILNQAYMNTDIVTSKVSEINITYQKNGNESKAYMVAEQLITKWNPVKGKFETVIYDKFM